MASGDGEDTVEVVLPLDDAAADFTSVGGKGASLARMGAAGLPVPAGFHITAEAYRRFVAGFRDGIDPADPAAAQALFARQDVPAAVAEEIRRAYRALGDDVPVAVRFFGDGRGPARPVLRGPAGLLPQRPGRRSAGGSQALLGVAVEPARRGLPRSARRRAR